ncbi:MAG: histidine kinase [Bacteroidetes bacterium]|nr:histidine kinase [Bacteroidota bacterium]
MRSPVLGFSYFYTLTNPTPIVKRLTSYIFLLFIFSVSQAFAQTPTFNFQKLGSEEGLNNANIFSITQNENGLMYFTTQNGIYVYDGYNFNKLEIDSLKSNALLNVTLGKSDEILLSLRNEGIARFNLQTKKYTFVPQLKFKNTADNFILAGDYAYLLTADIKLVIINLKTGELTEDQQRGKNRMNQAYCMFMTNEGTVLIGRSDGLYEVNAGIQKKLKLLENNAVHSITQNKEGRLFIGASGKTESSRIVIVNNGKIEKEIIPKYKAKASTYLPGGGKSIDRIVVDDYDRIWFTSYPGENLYLCQNNNFYDVFEILGITPTLIKCIFKDKDQNIWIGTYSDGVFFIGNSFFNALNFSFNNKILNVNQVCLKNNMLIAATSNGLYGLNLTSNVVKTLSKPDEFLTEPITSITEVNNVIYYSKRNQFDMSPAIFSDNKYNYHFKPVIAKLFYPTLNGANIVADWYANILLCNKDCSKTTDTLISFPDYQVSVNALLRLNDSLFVATNNGLYIYNFKTRKYNIVVRSELNYKINDIALINGKLFAAHEAGITNVTDNKLISQVGNLRLNSVKKIRQFNDKIWLATLDGVFMCDKNLQPLTILNKACGLPSNSINDIVFTETTICIATARGVAITGLEKIMARQVKLLPVTLSSITVDGSAIGFPQNTISLSSAQENVTVHFFSPLFNKPNKQFFRYKFDGEDWNILTNTSLTYPTIPGGKHKISIAASADNIVWSEPSVIYITKEEKLTETNWIYWIITCGGLLLIGLISFFILKNIKQKATKRLQEEQQVHLLKHQAMNALLSPHFIFNSLTSIQNYINTNNSLKASEYLAKFSRLIRMIIERAAQSEISLTDELMRLTYYLELEKERFKNKFDYEIFVDPSINQNEIKIPNMIIQPHVENCIIHGILPKLEHGVLKISFTKTNLHNLLIIVEDNGVGLIKAREHARTGHKSLGTSTIKNILEINSKLTGKKQNVTMTDKSTLVPPSMGTIITIELEQ